MENKLGNEGRVLEDTGNQNSIFHEDTEENDSPTADSKLWLRS